MALQKTVTTNSSIEVQNAYLRIDDIGGNKTIQKIALGVYVNKDKYNDGVSPVVTYYYSFQPSVDDSATNFIKQAYVYLKTLDEFKDATDC